MIELPPDRATSARHATHHHLTPSRGVGVFRERNRMHRKLWIQLVAVAALVVAVVALASTPSNAGTKPPSVRLLSVVQHVDVQRYQGQPDIYVDGINVASADGAFEVDA